MSGKSYVLDAQGTPHLVKKRFYVDAEGNVLPIKKSESNGKNVYSSSHIVTYHVNTNDIRAVEIDDGADAIAGAPTVTLSGYTFVGWRADTTASSSVIDSKTIEEDGVELYAIFSKTLTLSYNGNGATSGSTAAQTGTQYYNNGNQTSLTFTLRSNGYGRTDYTFNYWNTGSTTGTARNAGTSIEITDDTVMYEHWTYSASRSFSAPNAPIYAWYTVIYTAPISFNSITMYLSGTYSGVVLSGGDWVANIGGREYTFSGSGATVTLSTRSSWPAGTTIQVKNNKVSWGPNYFANISGSIGQ